MKKKNIATVIASTMAMASVMPVFAAEETVKTVLIDVRTANGEKLTVGEDIVENETVYFVEKTELQNEGEILKAKKAMDEAIADLEKMSKETYKDVVTDEEGNDTVVVKNKYDIKIDEQASLKKYFIDQRTREITDNKVVVVVTDNQTKEVTNYEFKGLKRLDLDAGFGQDDVVEPIVIDLAKKSQYRQMTKIQYELEKNADKIIVNKEEFRDEHQINNEHNLRLVVTLKDGTQVGNIILKNVESLNKDVYVSLPANGDIAGHWAEKTVLNAMFDKWVNASASFRPEDSITRAEFVKIVNRAFGIELETEDKSLNSGFEDVNTTDWYYEDVKTAARNGYINGYEDGTFKPNQPISRQEAAKVIARLVNGSDVEIVKKDVNGNKVEKDTKTEFVDDADIAVWADESVQYLADREIITGYENNTFKPAGNITRAEAVIMMSRAVK